MSGRGAYFLLPQQTRQRITLTVRSFMGKPKLLSRTATLRFGANFQPAVIHPPLPVELEWQDQTAPGSSHVTVVQAALRHYRLAIKQQGYGEESEKDLLLCQIAMIEDNLMHAVMERLSLATGVLHTIKQDRQHHEPLT